MSKIIEMSTIVWTNSKGVTFTYGSYNYSRFGVEYRPYETSLTESMLTGRWKEMTDSRGRVTIYVEATLPVTYRVEESTTIKHPIFWWRTKQIKSFETKEKTSTVWIPEDHIFFKESWEPEETIYECGG